jgi:hypothetical protein
VPSSESVTLLLSLLRTPFLPKEWHKTTVQPKIYEDNSEMTVNLILQNCHLNAKTSRCHSANGLRSLEVSSVVK